MGTPTALAAATALAVAFRMDASPGGSDGHEDPNGPPTWVHLLPAGTFAGSDGRGPYHLRDAAAVIAASMPVGPDGKPGRPLPIDYDHATDFGRGTGAPAPAAGWITAIEARDDGLWAKVEWTERAAAAIKAKEWRFISPVFLHAKDGTVQQLLRAGLVNDPNFTNLAAVASADNQSGAPHDGGTMDAKLLLALGLAATATLDDALAACAKLKADADGLKAVAVQLGHTGDMTATAIATHAKSLASDPAKFVPIEQLTAVNTRLATIETERAAEKADAAVDAAMRAGKVSPAMKDWAIAYASKDLPAFEVYLKTAPVIVAPGAAGPSGEPAPAAGANDPTALAVCKSLGITPEAYAKAGTKAA